MSVQSLRDDETAATTDHPVKVATREQGGHRIFCCERSAHEGRPQLVLRLNISLWLRPYLKNRGLLTLAQEC